MVFLRDGAYTPGRGDARKYKEEGCFSDFVIVIASQISSAVLPSLR